MSGGIGLKFHVLDEEMNQRISRLIEKFQDNKTIRSQIRKDDLEWLINYLEQVIA